MSVCWDKSKHQNGHKSPKSSFLRFLRLAPRVRLEDLWDSPTKLHWPALTGCVFGDDKFQISINLLGLCATM